MNDVPQPWQLTITQAVDAIRAGSLSSRHLLQSCLERIQAVEPQVCAWARLRADAALADADRFDQLPAQEKARFPLGGIPVGIKDVIYTADLETTANSRILEGFVPPRDAVAVERLRAAGAIILGKTHSTEFAFADPAPTRNPNNLNHTPGGSSSGSGAAVAAGMCLAAIGTQTSGSILRPAAYCGAVGFKPSYEAISREGVLPLAWSMDHVGPITRTVEDAALMFEAMAGPDWPATSTRIGRVRIGIPDRHFTDAAPAIRDRMEDVIATLADLGWSVQPVALPASFEAGLASASIVLAAEIAAAHEDSYYAGRDRYGPKLANTIEVGSRITATSYLRAQRLRRLAASAMDDLFDQVDFLLTPAIPATAPAGLDSTGDPKYLVPFSCFGLPAVSLPIGRDEASNLPFSLQLAGARGNDRNLLRAGQALEQRIAPMTTQNREYRMEPLPTSVSSC